MSMLRRALEILPDDELLAEYATWEHGAVLEWKWSKKKGRIINIRRAEKGEPGVRLMHGPDGPYLRVPTLTPEQIEAIELKAVELEAIEPPLLH
jgi:hypothetical protein